MHNATWVFFLLYHATSYKPSEQVASKNWGRKLADEHHVLLCSSLGMPCPVTRKHLLQKERQDCSKGGGVARRTLLEAYRHLMQNCLGPLNVWPPHSSCPDPQGSTKAGTLCMSSCHSSPPSLPNEDRKNLPPERRHKIQVRQNLAIPLVPKYKKMTIPLKKTI